MAAPQRRWAAEIVHFWFHRLTPEERFTPSQALDDELRRRFGPDLDALWHRPVHEFLTDPKGALAAVLLFDQIPRNLHRGTRRAFAFDPLARTICRSALLMGWDRGLTAEERQFLAMPLMHSEYIADQRWCLRIFARLGTRQGWQFAVDHHRMIARFGRFPHRNAVLGRKSSPAEKRALEQGFAW